MANIRLIIEYNGRGFSGWQVQPKDRTVQEELRKALITVTRQDISMPVASGRTDAGVSAKRQVVCFQADIENPEMLRKIMVGVSSILKTEVAILSIDIVADDFHPIRDALRKQYSYTVWNHPSPPCLQYGSCMHVVGDLDIGSMQQASEALIGEHDFTSFRASGCGAKSPVRTLESVSIERDDQLVIFQFQGRGFLKQMVRNLVGTLLDYGMDPDKTPAMKEVLEARDRTVAGPKAEPWGLTLDWVEYPEGRL